MTFRRGGGGKRRDASEPAIIDALRAVGAGVWQISGDGAPDLLVWFRGRYFVGEVKTATGARTPAQEQTRHPVWRTPDDALQAIGAMQ